MMQEWEELRRRARTLEADIDQKLIAFNQLSVTQVGRAAQCARPSMCAVCCGQKAGKDRVYARTRALEPPQRACVVRHVRGEAGIREDHAGRAPLRRVAMRPPRGPLCSATRDALSALPCFNELLYARHGCTITLRAARVEHCILHMCSGQRAGGPADGEGDALLQNGESTSLAAELDSYLSQVSPAACWPAGSRTLLCQKFAANDVILFAC